MLNTLRTSILAVAVGASASFVVGADVPRTASEQRAPDSPYSVRASDVIGAVVVNADNVELGTVDDIVIIRDSGELRAIVSEGGVFGVGDTLYSIPFDDLKAGSTDERVFLDMSKARFVELPPFEYLEGESAGRQIWEERLALQEKLAEERKDMKRERSDVEQRRQRIRELERKLEALRAQ